MNFTYNHGSSQAAFEAWANKNLKTIEDAYNSLKKEESELFDSLEDYAAALYFDMSEETSAVYLTAMST